MEDLDSDDSHAVLDGRDVVMFVTGSLNAALLPYWLNWVRHVRPLLRLHVILSQAATQFVTIESVRHMVSGDVFVDRWRGPNSTSHILIETRADAYAVFPCTLNTAMKLSSGLADTPALLALQRTLKPVVIAAAFGGSNDVTTQRLDDLLVRPNVGLAGTVPAYSVTSGAWTGETGFHLPSVLDSLAVALADER